MDSCTVHRKTDTSDVFKSLHAYSAHPWRLHSAFVTFACNIISNFIRYTEKHRLDAQLQHIEKRSKKQEI